MRRAGPVQEVVPRQQAVPVGAGQLQGLQGGSHAHPGQAQMPGGTASPAELAPQAGHSQSSHSTPGGQRPGPGRMAPQAGSRQLDLPERRQGPQQAPQQQPVAMQLAGQGVEAAQMLGAALGIGGGGCAGQQAPGQVSRKAPSCMATARTWTSSSKLQSRLTFVGGDCTGLVICCCTVRSPRTILRVYSSSDVLSVGVCRGGRWGSVAAAARSGKQPEGARREPQAAAPFRGSQRAGAAGAAANGRHPYRARLAWWWPQGWWRQGWRRPQGGQWSPSS